MSVCIKYFQFYLKKKKSRIYEIYFPLSRYSNCLFYYLYVAPWSIKKLKLYAEIINALSMIYPTNLLFLEKKLLFNQFAEIHEMSNYSISLQKFMKKAIKSVLQLQNLNYLY